MSAFPAVFTWTLREYSDYLLMHVCVWTKELAVDWMSKSKFKVKFKWSDTFCVWRENVSAHSWLWPLTSDLWPPHLNRLESGYLQNQPPSQNRLDVFSVHAPTQAGVTIAGLCCQWRPASSACYRSLTLHSVTTSTSPPVNHSPPPLCSALTEVKEGGREKCLFDWDRAR